MKLLMIVGLLLIILCQIIFISIRLVYFSLRFKTSLMILFHSYFRLSNMEFHRHLRTRKYLISMHTVILKSFPVESILLLRNRVNLYLKDSTRSELLHYRQEVLPFAQKIQEIGQLVSGALASVYLADRCRVVELRLNIP